MPLIAPFTASFPSLPVPVLHPLAPRISLSLLPPTSPLVKPFSILLANTHASIV